MSYAKDSKVGQAIDAIIADLPGTVAIAIVDLSSGMALGSHSAIPSFDPDMASAYNAEVIKQKQKAINALRLTGETIEDILITLTNQIHLIKLIGGGKYFIYYVANQRDTNIAMARSILRKHAESAGL